MNPRIKAYQAAVADTKRLDQRLRKAPRTADDLTGEELAEWDAATSATAQAYRNLTRSDCAELWYPGCPEAQDGSRRP